jgi:hypothetical protein
LPFRLKQEYFEAVEKYLVLSRQADIMALLNGPIGDFLCVTNAAAAKLSLKKPSRRR